MKNNIKTVRLPAEWEEQSGVMMTFPHANSDWGAMLDEVTPVFVRIASEIAKRQKLLLVCDDANRVEKLLKIGSVNLHNIIYAEVPSNDTWARDHAPIAIFENDKPKLLDFIFNGWGLKFAANLDNQISARLYEDGIFGETPAKTTAFVLEGGAIDSDGAGTLMTTAECMLSPNRNPTLSRRRIESKLKSFFGTERVLWLENGFLAGDDTDSHIDTLARFCSADTIAYTACERKNDEHYEQLKAMQNELKNFKTTQGKPYNLVPLPIPSPKIAPDGHRLPATYANFLIINGAVLLPVYEDANDEVATQRLQSCFPDREIIPIDCNPLIKWHGSLHCITMNFPRGVL